MLIVKKYYYVIADCLMMLLIYYASLFVLFDGHIPVEYMMAFEKSVYIYILIKVVVLVFSKAYFIIWKYASFVEIINMGISLMIGNASSILINMIIEPSRKLPTNVFVVVLLFDIIAITGYRLIPRFFHAIKPTKKNKKRAIIIGAGTAGTNLIKEIKHNSLLNYEPICFLDDDPNKKKRYINGVFVEGSIDMLPKVAQKYRATDVILAIPSLSKRERQNIIEKINHYGLTINTLPSLSEMMSFEPYKYEVREIQIEDLLEREEIFLDQSLLSELIIHKTILITGAGGSIGSELARQISKYHPKKLILLDIYENSLYFLERELKQEFKQQELDVIIETIRDKKRMDFVFDKYKPEVVFHAAAHKHVPLMEKSVHSAILNNIFGTYNLALCSDEYGVKKFIQISTDKAVNPTNVMGATKRICEMIMQAFDASSKTEFVSVRFGNVLGSNGSVIPIFLEQIKNGGPVTVTHKNVIRYFMTIPEACRLVIQAAGYAKGGEIFVLDMGEPVRILTLAENLIRLSGFKPYDEIDIKITGLREGEKLYEELLIDQEKMKSTEHDKIFIDHPQYINKEELEAILLPLKDDLYQYQEEKLIEILVKLVPSYKPNSIQ